MIFEVFKTHVFKFQVWKTYNPWKPNLRGTGNQRKVSYGLWAFCLEKQRLNGQQTSSSESPLFNKEKSLLM